MQQQMDLQQAHALARMDESRPDYTEAVLQASGFGELAEQWLTAADEFQSVARAQHGPEEELGAGVVRAYARMCVSWSRITQLREQAQVSIERLTHPA